MFTWISSYNYDYALSTIPIQLILIVFYGLRENLPTKQSYYFWFAMLTNFVMTITDIAACEVIEIWSVVPLWLVYGLNIAYFLAFLLRGWALWAYTAESTNNYVSINNTFSIFTALPMFIGCLMTLSTPWTSLIFTISDTGYHNGVCYDIVYFSTYFYLILSALVVVANWKKLNARMRTGLLTYNLILFVGILIRKQFHHVLVMSFFSLLAIQIIYLTAENPDLYREHRTNFLNEFALNRIGRELIEKHIKFSIIAVTINNYEANKVIFGAKHINSEVKIVSDFLSRIYPGFYYFYIRNGNYIILMKDKSIKSEDFVISSWKKHYTEFFHAIERIVPLQISMMFIPDNMTRDNPMLISELSRYALSNAYEENRKDNYVFSSLMLDGANKQKATEMVIKNAIKEKKFEVYFQPIYSVSSKKVMGAEALARLHDEELGFISPLEFIRIAERNGDIIEIGRQIFEKVCIFLSSIDTTELGIHFINVNLSPIQCINPSLVGDFAEIAARYHIPMEMFDFEITESMIEDYEAIRYTIAGFRSKGSELSLDDFGTGSANLASLMNFPIHVVKIDMSFVRSYIAGKAKFLPDLIKLFKHSDIDIVVEGIETQETMEKMKELGCDYEQGYYFSKPLPPDEFVSYMKNLQ